jgi:5-methylthioadenosine/S-adenosylhomocysteine deaminase
MHIHLSETKKEHDECVQKFGKTPARWFADLGTFDIPAFAAHCVWITDEDIALLAEKGVSVVHNPSSNMKLGSGFAPIVKMQKAGINITLGTDGAASNNALDFFREMYLTATLAKVKHMDAAVVDANEVLYSAISEGAHCMNLHDCDTIEVGKKADIIMIDMHKPNMQPENNIVKNLVYAGSKDNVKMTMVNGQILYRDGQFNLKYAPEEVYAKANEIINRMRNC